MLSMLTELQASDGACTSRDDATIPFLGSNTPSCEAGLCDTVHDRVKKWGERFRTVGIHVGNVTVCSWDRCKATFGR
jgi:hypothetical protein